MAAMALDSTCLRGMCEVIGAGVACGSAEIVAGTAKLGTARQRTSQLRNMAVSILTTNRRERAQILEMTKSK